MPASVKHLHDLLNNKERAKDVVLFAKWPTDRLFYRVDLVKLDHKEKKVLVRFEDNTEFDPSTSDVHLQLLNDQMFETICCICENDNSEKNNEIVVCDTCQQGYHQNCHPTKVPNSLLSPDKDWECSTCKYMISKRRTIKKETYSSTPNPLKKEIKKTTRVRLPPAPKPKVNKAAVKPSEEVKKSSQDVVKQPDNVDQGSSDESSGATDEIMDKVPACVAVAAETIADKPGPSTPDFLEAVSCGAIEDKVEPTEPVRSQGQTKAARNVEPVKADDAPSGSQDAKKKKAANVIKKAPAVKAARKPVTALAAKKEAKSVPKPA